MWFLLSEGYWADQHYKKRSTGARIKLNIVHCLYIFTNLYDQNISSHAAWSENATKHLIQDIHEC